MEEILPGLYRIIVPLPRNPLKEINSYIFTSDDRNLILDTGMNRPECIEVLNAGLAEIGLDMDRTDFFVTHLHADHLGLVSTLIKEGGKIFMGEGDVVILKKISAPDRCEFLALARKVRGQARRAGMKRSDVKKAVRVSRRRG